MNSLDPWLKCAWRCCSVSHVQSCSVLGTWCASSWEYKAVLPQSLHFTNWGGMTWRHSWRGMRRRAGTATPDSLNCSRGIYNRYEGKDEVLQTLPSRPPVVWSHSGAMFEYCSRRGSHDRILLCISFSLSLTWKYSWSCCRDMSCLGSHLAAWVPCGAVTNDTRNCNGHSGKGRLRTLDMAEWARKLPYSLGDWNWHYQILFTLHEYIFGQGEFSLSLSHVFTCFCIHCWSSMAQIQNDDLFKFRLGPLHRALGLLAQGWPG